MRFVLTNTRIVDQDTGRTLLEVHTADHGRVTLSRPMGEVVATVDDTVSAIMLAAKAVLS